MLAASGMERLLLAAIASKCISIGFYNSHVVDWLNELIGPAAGDVVRHVTSVVTTALMVSFAVALTRPTHIKWWLITGGATLAALMVMTGPAQFTITVDGTAV